MGRAITYCVQCSQRVSDADLEAGKAYRVGDRILCRACAPDSVKIQTTKKVQRKKDFGTSVTLKTQPHPPAAEPAANGPAKKLIFFGAGAAGILIVLGLLIALWLHGKPPPSVAVPPDIPTSPPTPVPASIDSKAAAASADLQKARDFAKAHPDDSAACMKEFNDLVWKWEGTEAAAEAAREAAAIKASNLEKVNAWMLGAEAELKPLLEKGDLRAAGKRMEEFKSAHNLLEWQQAVERRSSELLVEAVKAKERKKAEEERLLAAGNPKPSESTLSEEARGYPAKWEAAVARATARDYDGAILELERLAAGLKADDAREEAAQDVKDLKSAAALFRSSMDTLKKKAQGSALKVQVRRASGETKKLAGLILRIDVQRVQIQSGKDTAYVDWEDVATSTFADVAPAARVDPRILAELCLLEGEVDAAKACGAELSPKWWAFGARARSMLPKPDPAERSAREVFYAAEQGFRSMDTRAAAIDGYRTLKTDFSSTDLVKFYSERIARRMEAGREYYFAPADFHAEGSFRLQKSGKLESVKDSDDPDTLRNFAEIEFAALPNVGYRCWLWAGACCEETFLFYLQGTELVDTEPRTRKKIACEPGSSVASPVRHSIRGLKKTHAEHKIKGAKEHPKTAARWEWIEIPLPKFAAAGGKKLRFMTNQAGFAIGGAVVSASRKAAPTEPELKDLEKDLETPERLPLDPDLIAWWTFGEGGGTRVLDVTGKGHDAKVVGTVEWVDGRIGGAIRFASPGAMLQVEDAPDLRITGDLTLALWTKKEGEAGDWSCLVGKGERVTRNYCLWVESKTRIVMFQEHGDSWFNLKSTLGLTDGAWTHVAATVEGSKAVLYVNGLKDGDLVLGTPPATSAAPLGMGWACDHATFRGVLNDVRIYRRALRADEVRGLVDQAR